MNPNDPMSLPRPEIGRVEDPRVTAEYLASRPELRGLEPFDPERDVDTLGEVEGRLKYLHSLVAYADPELREDLVALRDQAEQTLANTAQTAADIAAAGQEALAQLGTMQTLISGVQVGSVVPADAGGQLITLEQASGTTLSATTQAAPTGGLLINLGGN